MTGDTYEAMMRAIYKWAGNKPSVGSEEMLNVGLAFICAEIDKLKSSNNTVLEDKCKN